MYARATDASVVVVRRDQTKRDALAHAVESLTLVGATVLGVVLDARSRGRFRQDAQASQPDPRHAATTVGVDAPSMQAQPATTMQAQPIRPVRRSRARTRANQRQD